MRMRRIGRSAVVFLALAPASYAQAPDPSASVSGPLPQATAYIYASAGRRDPFANPTRLVGPAGAQTRCRCGGFLIQEVALRGVVRTPKGYTAMLEGPDKKSYFAGVGEKLFDGAVVAVDFGGITFRQDITDPLSRAKTRELRILLHADDTFSPR